VILLKCKRQNWICVLTISVSELWHVKASVRLSIISSLPADLGMLRVFVSGTCSVGMSMKKNWSST